MLRIEREFHIEEDYDDRHQKWRQNNFQPSPILFYSIANDFPRKSYNTAVYTAIGQDCDRKISEYNNFQIISRIKMATMDV